jgi:hypothetical protein
MDGRVRQQDRRRAAPDNRQIIESGAGAQVSVASNGKPLAAGRWR